MNFISKNIKIYKFPFLLSYKNYRYNSTISSNSAINDTIVTSVKWRNLKYPISTEGSLLFRGMLIKYIILFWREVMINLGKDYYVLMNIKLKFMDNSFASVHNYLKISQLDLRNLIRIYLGILEIKDNRYKEFGILELIFSYKILPLNGKAIKKAKFTNIQKMVVQRPSSKIGGYTIPNTMDLSTYGIILVNNDNKVIIRKSHSSLTYIIEIFSDKNKVKIFNGSLELLSFTDYKGSNLNSFTRVYENKSFYYEDGELKLSIYNKKLQFIKKLKGNLKINNKIMTLDIETKNINDKLTPYCISIFDGEKFITYYLTSFKNADDMVLTALTNIMSPKYNGYTVYTHNLSNFDGIFILRLLSNFNNTKVNILKKDEKLYSIKLTISDKYTITIMDSLLVLPVSLKKLAIAFNVDNKQIFPYDFVNNLMNKDLNLNYEGIVPDHKYFNDVTLEEYTNYISKYTNNKWSLQKETISYCENDCNILYQILIKFNDLIFNKFKVNIVKYPTLAALTFANYRTNFLNEHKIPIITGEMYFDIQKAYSGGALDFYKPFGENIKLYDVNSLYPYVMVNNDMPVGQPIYFEGDLSLSNYNKINNLAFFEVDIKSPDYLAHPILQTKIRTKDGLRTMSPLGSWTDWIYSEEMYNAEKYGYKFTVKRGYIFERGRPFADYINNLYDIKKSHTSDQPLYLISKLLMNSLYGRFGMDYMFDNTTIINTVQESQYIEDYQVSSIIEMDNNKSLITYNDPNKFDDLLMNSHNQPNVSISISAAISSYGRIYMSQFKNNPNIDLYYSDTDSIAVGPNSIIYPNLIGKEIGQLKLEYEFKEAVFLMSKVWGGLSNKEIVRVKGLKNKVPYITLKSLLAKDAVLSLNHNKWHKDFESGSIHIRNQIYTLMLNENKRKLIYQNNILVNTSPFIINSNKEIV